MTWIVHLLYGAGDVSCTEDSLFRYEVKSILLAKLCPADDHQLYSGSGALIPPVKVLNEH